MSQQTTTVYTCDGCGKTTPDNVYWYQVTCAPPPRNTLTYYPTLAPNDFCSPRCLAVHYAKAARLMLVDTPPRRDEVAEIAALSRALQERADGTRGSEA